MVCQAREARGGVRETPVARARSTDAVHHPRCHLQRFKDGDAAANEQNVQCVGWGFLAIEARSPCDGMVTPTHEHDGAKAVATRTEAVPAPHLPQERVVLHDEVIEQLLLVVSSVLRVQVPAVARRNVAQGGVRLAVAHTTSSPAPTIASMATRSRTPSEASRRRT